MYFASDFKNAQGLVDAVLEQIAALPSARWMALLDSAFDYGGKALRWHAEAVRIYEGNEMVQFAEVSPVLLPLSSHLPEQLKQEILRLAYHCKERPMLSFVATSLSDKEVAEAWQPFLKVKTDDEQTFVLRFADTRVLPALAASLRRESWHALTHALDVWLFVNRAGDLEQLALVKDDLRVEDKLTLKAQELASLLEHGQADAVIDVLAEQMPDLVPETQRAAFHASIDAMCTFAKNHGVTAFPDYVALATLGCVTDGRALADPGLKQLLQQGEWESGNLIAKLEDFVDY